MNIFISHATANSHIAQTLAEAIEAAGENVTTFVASRPGDIRADEDWIKGIESALQKADAYIVILTPESVLRPWVNFESGAAWFFKRQLVFVRIQALSTDEIPLPIASRQVYALDDEQQLRAIFQTLRLPLSNPDKWVARFIQDAVEDVVSGSSEPAWEGVQIQDVFYAWAGPLLHLRGCNSVSAPAGLLDEIQRRGLRPRWANLGRISHHVERGLAQVFATDRETWRRPVMDRNRPLMVGNPKAG